MEFLKAVSSDAPIIHQIMTLGLSTMEHKEWYVIDSEDYIRKHIEQPETGLVLKAVENGQIAAFLIVHYPKSEHDNMGHYLNLDDNECLKVAYMDSVCVLPVFRGRGLQYDLISLGETFLQSTPYCHFMATVHPDNRYSLANLMKLGYRIVTTTTKYGDLPRHILYKHKIPL